MELDKTVVENRIRECLIKGNKHYRAKAKIDRVIYMGGWTAASTGKAGVTKTGSTYIKLSKHFLEAEPQWMMDEIIPHEVAHIIGFWLNDHGMDGSDDHDDRWAEIAKYLGCSGEENPVMPESHPFRNRFHYKTSTGKDIYLDADKHEMLQKQFKVLTDKRDGGKITASFYLPK